MDYVWRIFFEHTVPTQQLCLFHNFRFQLQPSTLQPLVAQIFSSSDCLLFCAARSELDPNTKGQVLCRFNYIL